MAMFLGIDWSDLSGRKARKKLKELEEQKEKEKLVEDSKPYLKAYFSNHTITVVFKDGEVVSVVGTEEEFRKVQSIRYEALIKSFLLERNKETEEVFKDEQENLRLLDFNEEILEILGEDFTNDSKGFYYKGITLPIPSKVLESMVEYKKAQNEDMFQRLVYFFLLLATSPISECRENVLRFCKKNDVHISKRGNIIAYRRIVKILDNTNLALKSFVEDSYKKVKKNKKSPNRFDVYSNVMDPSKFVITGKDKGPKWKFEGSLMGLKNEFDKPQEQFYTSYHNAGKHTFRVGDVYKIEDSEIDLNASNCASGGLHAAAVNYDYNGFGDTPVVVLVNPSKSILTPTYDFSKFRTVEMKIAMINPNEHGVHIDEALLEEADKEYSNYTQESLEQALKNKSFGALTIKEEVPLINLLDLKTIQESLKNRVVKI